MRAAHAANNEDTGEGERDDQDDDRHGHQPCPARSSWLFRCGVCPSGGRRHSGRGLRRRRCGRGLRRRRCGRGRALRSTRVDAHATHLLNSGDHAILPDACGQRRRPACYHPYLLTNYKLTVFTNRCAHSRRINPLRCVGIFVLILPPAMRTCVHSAVIGTHGGTMCAQDREGAAP